MGKAQYIVGIDLGTSNSTLSSILLDEEDDFSIQLHRVNQMLNEGMEGEADVLPSFLYFPLENEKKQGGFQSSLEKEEAFTVGTLARDRGVELPHHLISSAKSWLCHE